MRKLAIVLILLAAGAARSAQAATINAASCSQANVQSAINSASSGDIVSVPGGSATWTSLTIPIGVQVRGGGCVVTITVENAITANMNNPAGGAITVLSGFTFNSNGTQAVFMDWYGVGPGLITGNTFIGGAASEMIHNMGFGPSGNAGYSNNAVPGGPNALYVENNTFTCPPSSCPTFDGGTQAIESYYGAQTVFRFNTLTMAEIDQHGTPGLPWARWWEIYNNTFTQPSSAQEVSAYITLRGGSGVVFNNAHTGTNGSTNAGISIWVECNSPGVQCGSGATYPQSDQVGRGISQNLSPAYLWNNTDAQPGFGGQMMTASQSPLAQLNRDFYVNATTQQSPMKRFELTTDNSSTTYNYVPYTYPYPLAAAPGASLAPSSLTFANQVITTTSAAQSTTLTNNGTATLTISSITLTGTNAGDYAISANSCSATLAQSASCVVSVTFTPSATGARTAAVSVADNATGSPHTAALTGNGVPAITPPGPHKPVILGSLPSGTVGVTYAGGLTASADSPPLVWTVNPSIPGLALNASTGVLSGTPTAAAMTNLTFGLTDAYQCGATDPPGCTNVAAPVTTPLVIAAAPPPPPACAGTSFFAAGAGPASPVGTDATANELGMVLSAKVGWTINCVRFYKVTSGNSTPTAPTHTWHVWSAAGASLATGTFGVETASGWQTAALATPLAVAAGASVTVSYNTGATGEYAYTASYFAAAKADATGTLTAPASAGVYHSSATPSFPTSTYKAANYWADVVFTLAAPPPPPPLAWTCTGATCVASGGTSGQTVPTQLNPPSGPTGTVRLP